MTETLYDRIGVGYAGYRRPDARIAARIGEALADARTVVNVGAGTGSYEPADRRVVAVEPSAEMLRQRPPDAAPAVQGVAERLPFADGAFDAALAVLTVHHWTDWRRGVAEMRRVARGRVVILTIDPARSGFWLHDYFPALRAIDDEMLPPLDAVADALGPAEAWPVPVPWDCSDGFLGAYWRRPERYLDPGARGAISAFARLGDPEPGVARLRADLADGAWGRRNGSLASLPELDLGYRLLIA